MVGSSLRFTPDWAREEMNESLWDLSNYAFSRRVLFLIRPVVVSRLRIWPELKVASYTIPFVPGKTSGRAEVSPSTEPPNET